MRFVVENKDELDGHYVITLANRPGEDRYGIIGENIEVVVNKGARFSSAEKNGLTPEEDNKRWYNSFEVGSEFNLSPKDAK